MVMVLNNPPAEMDGTTEQPLLQQVSIAAACVYYAGGKHGEPWILSCQMCA